MNPALTRRVAAIRDASLTPEPMRALLAEVVQALVQQEITIAQLRHQLARSTEKLDEIVDDAAERERVEPTATYSCVPQRIVRKGVVLPFLRRELVPVFAVGDAR